MRNVSANLGLLAVALASTMAFQGYSAGPDDPGFTQYAGPDAMTSVEAEPVLSEGAFPPQEFRCVPAPFACCERAVKPSWYFRAVGLALKRDASGDQTWQAFVEREFEQVENPLYDAEADPPDPDEPEYIWQWASDTVTPVLGTQHLDFDFQGGGRLLLGRTLGLNHAFEVSYFDLTEWDQIAAVRDDTEFLEDVDREDGTETTFPASLFSPFSDFGDPGIQGLDYNKLASISYTSDLDNLEWNLRRWILYGPGQLQASVLVGGRYMNLGETFSYYTESDVPDPGGATNSVRTVTSNNMLGVQIGAMFEFYVDPGWWVDCEIKGGVFSNDAGQNTRFISTGSPTYRGTHWGRRDEDITSWVLDLRLSATFLVTPCLAVTGGYQALWLDGLALASENMSQDVDVLAFGPATLVHDGKALYHGPHLGLTWLW